MCLFASNCSNKFSPSTSSWALNSTATCIWAELYGVIWAALPELIGRILQALCEAVGLVPQVGVESHQPPGQHGGAADTAGECEITATGGELIQVGEKVGPVGGKSGGPGVRNLSVELRLQLQ